MLVRPFRKCHLGVLILHQFFQPGILLDGWTAVGTLDGADLQEIIWNFWSSSKDSDGGGDYRFLHLCVVNNDAGSDTL